MRRVGHRANRAAQRGVAVLMLLLVLLSVGGYGLLRALNQSQQHQPAATRASAAALAEARRALLGYAASYPDRAGVTSLTAGPGLLPCPDTRLDSGDVAGQADPPCALASATETGLLPWRTLDMNDLRDGSGAPLWYALANGYRNNPAGILNSDTLAALRLDDCAPSGRAIVALILAPGSALAGQNRATTLKSQRYAPANYLETANASRGDGCFASARSDFANDTLAVIDRAALNRIIETRVLADVTRALQRYYADPEGNDVAGLDPLCAAAGQPSHCDEAWPWLAPYANPATSPYGGVAGTRVGHLPLRRVGIDFNAPFSARWTLLGGSFSATGALPPSEVCVRNSLALCRVQPTGFLGALTLSGDLVAASSGQCRWLGGPALRCVAVLEWADPGGSGNTLVRSYTLEFRGLPRRIVGPTALLPRRESATLGPGVLPVGASLILTLSDTLRARGGGVQILGEGRLSLLAGAAVTQFDIVGVPLDLEVDDDHLLDPSTRRSPGELPAWFTANAWQQFVVVAYAAAHSPGNPASNCTPAVDCLWIERRPAVGQPSIANDVPGLVLLAGALLPGQTRPGSTPAAWFEADNALLGRHYTARSPDATFNDRLRRLAP